MSPVLAYSSPCRRRQIIHTPSQASWSGPPHRIQVFSLFSPSLLTNRRSEDRILPSSIPRVLLGSLRSSQGTLGCRPGTRIQCCPLSIHLPVFYQGISRAAVTFDTYPDSALDGSHR